MKSYREYVTEAVALTPYKYSLSYAGVSDSDPCLRYVAKKNSRHIYTFGGYKNKIRISLHDDMRDKDYEGFAPKQIKALSDITLGYGSESERRRIAVALEQDGVTVQEINSILKRVG